MPTKKRPPQTAAQRRGRQSRKSGHDLERWTAAALRRYWGTANRGLQSRGGGAEAADVEGTPFRIECKTGRKVSVAAAMRQVNLDAIKADDDRPTVVVVRDFGVGTPWVALPWATFDRLCGLIARRLEDHVADREADPALRIDRGGEGGEGEGARPEAPAGRAGPGR